MAQATRRLIPRSSRVWRALIPPACGGAVWRFRPTLKGEVAPEGATSPGARRRRRRSLSLKVNHRDFPPSAAAANTGAAPAVSIEPSPDARGGSTALRTWGAKNATFPSERTRRAREECHRRIEQPLASSPNEVQSPAVDALHIDDESPSLVASLFAIPPQSVAELRHRMSKTTQRHRDGRGL